MAFNLNSSSTADIRPTQFCSAHPPERAPSVGHNRPTFDDIVEENLLRGIYLVQLQALQRCIKDPRLDQRHRLVLVALTERTNTKSAVAYPGRAWLAKNIVYYFNGEPRRYSEGTIANTLSELANLEYLMTSKRAPVGGGRALMHYAVTPPSLEEMQAKIAEACAVIRSAPRRRFPAPDVNSGVDVKTGGDVNTGVKADVNAGVGTVTGINLTGRAPLSPLGEADLKLHNGQPLQLQAPIEAAFEEFWVAFPRGRKQRKGDAQDTFKAIVTGQHKRRKATAQALIDGARRYAATHPDPLYTPLPTTWLNSGSWMDDLPPLPGQGTPAIDEFAAAIERARRIEEEEDRCRR